MVRTFIGALLILAASGVPATGQEWARKMFETTSHDFGAVARGAKVEFHFNFSNIYQEDIHVVGVRSSCGCTSPTILKDPLNPNVTKDSLKTYEKSAIVASFNTRAFLGQRKATLTVTIDKPFYAEVQLTVAGYIRSDIVVNPGGVEFGSIDQGVGAEKRLSISYAGRSDWEILDIKSGSPYVEAEVVEAARGGGQVRYDLTVFLKPDAPPGYLKQQLILVTNDRRASEFPVDIEGRVVSEITISPASLFMGAVKAGQSVTKQLVVQAKKPFRITGVTCDEECFKIAMPDTAKIVHLVPVTFVAGDKPGKISYKIRIETDLGEGASSELTAYAQVLAPAPDLTAQP